MYTLEKRGNIFLLTLTGDHQHRFNPTNIASLRSVHFDVKSQSTPGSVLITVTQGKFFSNGFDLTWAQSAGSPSEVFNRLRLIVNLFKLVVADLISLPMQTIAAITDHAAAARLMFDLSHDYVLMRRDRGVLYMSELDIGLTLPEYFAVLFRSKLPSPAARRAVLLKGEKVKVDEAVAMGIIDSAHDSEEKTVAA